MKRSRVFSRTNLPDFEFIIINDGSTDGTAAILDSYARKDSRLRVYRQENSGQCASDNRGCGMARGKYIAHMDADDVSLPYRLDRQIAFLEKHENVGVLGGAADIIDEHGRRVSHEQPPLEDELIRAAFRSFSNPILHPAVVMRKQAFDVTGGYRPQFLRAEDIDLWLRVIERWRAANLSDVVLRRRIHSAQISVCHVRQQFLSFLGAHALSSARQRDSIEPPCEEVISEAFLDKLGVSQTVRQRTFAGFYGYWIGSMSQTCQDDAVVKLVDEFMNLSKSGPADRIALANAMLLAARSHYRRGRPACALVFLGRAVLARPIIAGRPLKRAVNSLFHKPQVKAGRA